MIALFYARFLSMSAPTTAIAMIIAITAAIKYIAKSPIVTAAAWVVVGAGVGEAEACVTVAKVVAVE